MRKRVLDQESLQIPSRPGIGSIKFYVPRIVAFLVRMGLTRIAVGHRPLTIAESEVPVVGTTG